MAKSTKNKEIVENTKSKKKRWDSKQTAALVMILIMVFSMGAGVVGWLAGSTKTPETITNQTGAHVGVLNGLDIYEVNDKDYYTDVPTGAGSRPIEWHFRANPISAANVSINNKAKYYLGAVATNHPFILRWENITKVYITFDPYDKPEVIVSGTEIAYGLGAVGWSEGEGKLGTAYTKESVERPEVPVMTTRELLDNKTEGILAINLYVDNQSVTRIEGMGSNETDKIILVHGTNETDLDLAAVKVKLILLGIIEP